MHIYSALDSCMLLIEKLEQLLRALHSKHRSPEAELDTSWSVEGAL